MAAGGDDEVATLNLVVQAQDAAGAAAEVELVLRWGKVCNRIPATDHEGICAAVAGQDIAAATADQRVIAAAAADFVIAAAPVYDICPAIAGEFVVDHIVTINDARAAGTDVGANDILEIIQHVSLGVIILINVPVTICHISMGATHLGCTII